MNTSVVEEHAVDTLAVEPTAAPPAQTAAAGAEGGVAPRAPRRDRAFWCSLAALFLCDVLSALDLTAVSTALPTISAQLHDHHSSTSSSGNTTTSGDTGDAVWIGSAYALASTACLPLSGALADALGRRAVLLGFIALFAAGSALAGAAPSMSVMIAARSEWNPSASLLVHIDDERDWCTAIQGVGGGGVLNLTRTVLTDIVPLAERGLFQGIFGLLWSFASAIGPTIVRVADQTHRTGPITLFVSL